jgi:hypothetical protein
MEGAVTMTPTTQMPGALDVTAERIQFVHRQTVFVTGAIAASLVVYAVLVELLRRTLPPATDLPPVDMLRIALFAVAGVLVFTTTVLKSMLLRNAPPSGEMRLARLRTAGIIVAAFAEVPVILGLVLFIFGRLTTDFYILLVVSLYILARHYPRREQWDGYVQRGNAR